MSSTALAVSQAPQQVFTYDLLPAADKQEVDAYVASFDITNEDMRTNFGAKALEQFKQSTNAKLKEVAGTKAGKSAKNEMMHLILKVNKVDLSPSFWEKLFASGKGKMNKVRTKLQSIDGIITQIEKELSAHQGQLEDSKEGVIEHARNVVMTLLNIEKCIIAGEMCLQKEREGRLVDLNKVWETSGSSADRIALVDAEKACTQFEITIADFRTMQAALYNSVLTAYHQKYAYESEIEGYRRMQRVLIPILADQSLALVRNEELADSANTKSELTQGLEKVITHNTTKLHQTAIEIARASNKPLIETSVLAESLQTLMKVGAEVNAIEVESLIKLRITKEEHDKIISDVRVNFLGTTGTSESAEVKALTTGSTTGIL